MLKKLVISINMALVAMTSTAFAATTQGVTVTTTGQAPESLNAFFSTLTSQIMPYASQIGGFLIFIAVVMVGFEVIKHRNDGEKRKEALHSLLWLAVGAFIIGSAVVIASILWGAAPKL